MATYITTNIHRVTALAVSQSPVQLSGGSYTTSVVIEAEHGNYEIVAFSDAPLDVKADAAQTAAYAEGRKDEREEWEALREQMLEALRGVRLLMNAGAFKEFEGEPWLKQVDAAINKATGEQP